MSEGNAAVQVSTAETKPAVDDCAVLSVPEAGRRLGLCRQSAYYAAQRGEIPTIRIGGKILVPKVQLERLISGER